MKKQVFPLISDISTGIDYSTAMLACTQKKIDEMGREGVRAFQHSLHDTLPFEDNTFDVVLHNQVMHHLIYPENQDPLASVKRYVLLTDSGSFR